MTRHQKPSLVAPGIVEIKSQFGAEFRRVSIARCPPPRLEEFRALLLRLHGLAGMVGGASAGGSKKTAAGAAGGGGRRGRGGGGELVVCYTVSDGSLLPITNSHNFAKAIAGAAPLLRITVTIADDAQLATAAVSSSAIAKRGVFSGLRGRDGAPHASRLPVGPPRDFHPLSSLIDVDVLPASLRRVRLYRHGSARPLGFYVADRSADGRARLGGRGGAGVFISRLLPGGLAASSGLLSVGDRVLEVNGAPVAGKGLDEVTAMMVANGHHLVITVRPAELERRDGGDDGGVGGGGNDDEFWTRDSGSSESSVQSLVSDGSEGMRLSRRGSQRHHHHQQQQQKKRNHVKEEVSLTSRSGGDSDSLALAPLLSDTELWDSEAEEEDLVIDQIGVDRHADFPAAGKPGRPLATYDGGVRNSPWAHRRSGTVTEEGGVITLYL
ncbi:partitioning defective 6 homolog beta-like [Lethenteron reissneri]|uniref:partitioning defective 6 homolog beta-like n=1 Tax=Lethenteron reissneri TaxID=7753 RepID=UPI002AB6286D|nr:partitioning defective 6 homolog beta-like [Lethenteron reissneri]